MTRFLQFLYSFGACFLLATGAHGQGMFFPPAGHESRVTNCSEQATGLNIDCRVQSPGVTIPAGTSFVAVDESNTTANGSASLFLEWQWRLSPTRISFSVEDGSGVFHDSFSVGGFGHLGAYLLLAPGPYIVPPSISSFIRPIALTGNVSDGGFVEFTLDLGSTFIFCAFQPLTATYYNDTPGPFSVTLPGQIVTNTCNPNFVGTLSEYRIALTFNTRVREGASGHSSIKLSETIDFGSTDTPADIDVAPAAVNFGDVEVGTSQSAMVTISNVGTVDLTVSNISLRTGADYAITSAPVLPAIIPVGGSEDVTVTFTPLATGPRPADYLDIVSNDPVDGLVSVPLNGTGVMEDVPPSEEIANIIMSIEDGVVLGTIVPEGPGNSGPGRLDALINMISAAGDLISDGLIDEACQQLLDAYRKMDGLSGRGEPPDFISGPDTALIASLIQDLRTDLGCP